MNDCAIQVEHLSKAYRIGAAEQRHETMLGALGALLKAPLANFRNLRKLSRFDSPDEADVLWAIKDVSFEVKRGEAVGIIGRNGAGKSTLLKLLSRIMDPTSGRAQVFGRVASLLEVGTGFHPDLTGRENIFLNGTILGMRKREIDARLDEIVAFSGVEKFLDTPVKRYSSGMRVRLAFSVAAHLEPEVLIIDEVLAVGDAAFQRKCLGKMGEVTGRGRTVLFVSHNMGAMTTLCPRSLWLDAGQVVDSGPSQEIVAKYIGHASKLMRSGGYNDLTNVERPSSLGHRHAQFNWVRTLRSDGQTSGGFMEGESFIVEVGFQLQKNASSVQLGCGVRPAESEAELFTVPSPEFGSSFGAGHYLARMTVAPNHFRDGSYRLVLKMFVDGVRQDTIADVLQISITSCRTTDDMTALSQRWVSGPLRIDYRWDAPVPHGPEGNVALPDEPAVTLSAPA